MLFLEGLLQSKSLKVTIFRLERRFEAKQLGIDDVDIDDLGGQGQMCPLIDMNLKVG